jgi:hypothetical protein
LTVNTFPTPLSTITAANNTTLLRVWNHRPLAESLAVRPPKFEKVTSLSKVLLAHQPETPATIIRPKHCLLSNSFDSAFEIEFDDVQNYGHLQNGIFPC